MKYKDTELFISEEGVEYHFTHDYCVVIYGLKFRDVQGRDLTYTDYVFNMYSEEYRSSLNFVLEFLTHFCVSNSDILLEMAPYHLVNIFQIFMEKVLRGLPSREAWMNNVYYLNGGSFCNLSAYESIPMTEILEMINIHKARIDREKELLNS